MDNNTSLAISRSDESEFRFERKFVIGESVSVSEVESMIRNHSAFFRPLHVERQVNNLYFDTSARIAYHENKFGLRDRAKIRLRWYGDLFGHNKSAYLEKKIKRNAAGAKVRFEVPGFVFEQDASATLPWLSNAIRNAALPAWLAEELGSTSPSLVNSYKRKYYTDADRKFRLTLDHHLEYFRLDRAGRVNPLNGGKNAIVLELKYAMKDDVIAESVTGGFPIPLSKNSKYINGIDQLLSE